MNNEHEYGFNLQEWKLREIQKYNNMTNGRHTFRAKPMSYTEQRLTLADGTVILTPEEGMWAGKPIMLENGTPLPPGEYTLANSMHSSGRIIVIGRDGNVKEVREPVQTIKNKVTAMNTQEMIHDWRLKELQKLPENQQLRKQAIEKLSRDIEALKRETSNLKKDAVSPEEQMIMGLLKLSKLLVDKL